MDQTLIKLDGAGFTIDRGVVIDRDSMIQASGSSCATRDQDRWKAIERGGRGGAVHKATRRGRGTAISHGHSRAHARMRSRISSRIHVDSRLSAAAVANVVISWYVDHVDFYYHSSFLFFFLICFKIEVVFDVAL